MAAYDPQVGHTYAGAEISNLATTHRILLDQALEEKAEAGVSLVKQRSLERAREPEMLTLKPGVWGVSFDIKAAFRRFSRWKRSRQQH